jgi:hypothetical protein
MSDAMRKPEYQESKIEDEPILGTVLMLPDGRVQTLTFMEKLCLTLGLTSVKQLEARHFRPANS